MRNIILGICLLYWPAFICRIHSLYEETIVLRWSDAIGFSWDLCFAILASSFLWGFFKKRTALLASILISILGFSYAANYEHIKANYANVDLRFFFYVFDGTFFSGSIQSRIGSYHLWLATLPPLFINAYFKPFSKTHIHKFSLCFALFFFLSMIFPAKKDLALWRQTNVFFHNVKMLTFETTKELFAQKTSSSVSPEILKTVFEQNLNGEPRWQNQPIAKNILLITLEGIPQGVVDGQRNEADHSQHFMPFYKTLTESALSYTHMISLQRQTNRGQYAILCGDFPNLQNVSAKMDVYRSLQTWEKKTTHQCLPSLLQEHGFHTVYLQSAPISFMGKDHFMREAGFEEVYDTKWFGKSLARNGWGIDDRTFLNGVLDLVQKLKAQQNKPWFLNVMSSGTHHPYIIPDEWKGKTGIGVGLEDSFLYLDGALKDFISALTTSKILEDTLVILTSDEAAGFDHPDNLVEALTHNHIPLVMLGPGIPQKTQVNDFYSQADLALSIADYLKIPAPDSFRGLSLFRNYEHTRYIPFANIYGQKIFLLTPSRTLLRCSTTMGSCATFKGSAFAGPFQEIQTQNDDVGLLKDIIQKNDWDKKHHDEEHLVLTPEEMMAFQENSSQQTIFISPKLKFETNKTLEVSIHLKVQSGTLVLVHEILSYKSNSRFHVFPKLLLPTGSTLKLRYQVSMKDPEEELEFRLFGWNYWQDDAKLEVLEATLKTQKWIPSQTPDNPLEFSVDIPQPSTITLNGFWPDLSYWAPCKKAQPDGSITLENCTSKTLGFGPYLAMPKGVQIDLTFAGKSTGNPIRFFLDISHKQGQEILQTSDISEVPPETSFEKSLHYELPENSKNLEWRFNVENPAPNNMIHINTAEIILKIPATSF